MSDCTSLCENEPVFSDPLQLLALDRQLLLLTQDGLPLVTRPYDKLAEQLGITPSVVKSRLQSMLDDGRIRRIAAVPNHYKLGYTVNAMTVWDVNDRYVFELGRKVGALDFVSHCYLRPRHLPEWPYNLFAMVHGKTRQSVDQLIDSVEMLLGRYCTQHQALLSIKILKKTGLRFSSKGCVEQATDSQKSTTLDRTPIME